MVEISQVTDDTDVTPDASAAASSDVPSDASPVTKDTKTDAAAIDSDGWKELMGQDLVMKVLPESEAVGKVLYKSSEVKEIQHGDTVLVSFVARIANDREADIATAPVVQRVDGWLLGVGEGDVLPAVEMGIRFLHVGQTGRVWSHSKFAWGLGRRIWKDDTKTDSEPVELPPNTNVFYDITVTQSVVDTSRLNPYFTIQRALTRKTIANDIYSCEFLTATSNENSMSIPRAIRLYQKVATDMEGLLNGTYFANVEADHPQKYQCQKIQLDCLNNVSAVFMKQHKYHDAKEAAVKVLALDRNNLKGLLRAAKAALLDPASMLEEAKAALDAADSAVTYKNPAEEKEVKRLKVLYKQKAKDYKEQSKAMYGKMLKSTPKKVKPVVVDAENPSTTNESRSATVTDEVPEKPDTAEEGVFSGINKYLLAFQLILPIVMYVTFTMLRQKPMAMEEEL